jgi:hypothetical protein
LDAERGWQVAEREESMRRIWRSSAQMMGEENDKRE